MNLIDLFAPEGYRSRSELISELRKPVNAIGPFAHRGASKQEIVVSMVFFRFETQGVDARIAMIQDETARHTAEEALRTSEERFRELFENANDVIFLHDLTGKVITVNRAAEYLTGYSRTEVIGQSFEALIAPEARDQTQDSIRAHLGGSATQHYELPDSFEVWNTQVSGSQHADHLSPWPSCRHPGNWPRYHGTEVSATAPSGVIP